MNEPWRSIFIVALVLLGGILLVWLIFIVVTTAGPMLVSAVASAFQLILSIVAWIITIGIGLCVAILAIAVPAIVGVYAVNVALVGVKGVTASIGSIGTKVDELRAKMSEDARDTTIDTIFLGILALLAGFVFYVSTGDFVKNEEDAKVVKVLAVGAMACSAAKVLLMFPVRPVKALAVLLFLGSSISVGWFLYVHYNLRTEAGALATTIEKQIFEPSFMGAALVAIALLFIASVGYPFTWKRWKKMLFFDK
jgi:hypothetical protein